MHPSRLYSSGAGIPSQLVPAVRGLVASQGRRAYLRIVGGRVLVVGEIHALLVGGVRQQRLFLNVIRLLANELEMPLVCAGTPEDPELGSLNIKGGPHTAPGSC